MLWSLRLLGMTLSCSELYESTPCCDGSTCIAHWRVPLATVHPLGPRSRAGILANCTAGVRRVRAHAQRCAPAYAEGTVKSLPRSPSRARRGCHIRNRRDSARLGPTSAPGLGRISPLALPCSDPPPAGVSVLCVAYCVPALRVPKVADAAPVLHHWQASSVLCMSRSESSKPPPLQRRAPCASW